MAVYSIFKVQQEIVFLLTLLELFCQNGEPGKYFFEKSHFFSSEGTKKRPSQSRRPAMSAKNPMRIVFLTGSWGVSGVRKLIVLTPNGNSPRYFGHLNLDSIYKYRFFFLRFAYN